MQNIFIGKCLNISRMEVIGNVLMYVWKISKLTYEGFFFFLPYANLNYKFISPCDIFFFFFECITYYAITRI